MRHGYCTKCSSHTVAKKWFGPLFCINTECDGSKEADSK